VSAQTSPHIYLYLYHLRSVAIYLYGVVKNRANTIVATSHQRDTISGDILTEKWGNGQNGRNVLPIANLMADSESKSAFIFMFCGDHDFGVGGRKGRPIQFREWCCGGRRSMANGCGATRTYDMYVDDVWWYVGVYDRVVTRVVENVHKLQINLQYISWLHIRS